MSQIQEYLSTSTPATVNSEILEPEVLPPLIAPDGYFRFVLYPSPFRQERREMMVPVGTPLHQVVNDLLDNPSDTPVEFLKLGVNDQVLEGENTSDYSPTSGELIVARVQPGVEVIIGLLVVSTVLQVAGIITGNQTLMYVGAGIGMLALGAGFFASGALAAGSTVATTGLASTSTTFGGLSIGQAAAIGSLAVGAAGMVNTLVRGQPNIPDTATVEDSPYLAGATNQARLWRPIPNVFGRVTHAPPMGAQFYNEAPGNVMSRMIYTPGYGRVEIDESSIKIGSEPLATIETDYNIEIREGFAEDPPLTLYSSDINPLGVTAVLIKKNSEPEAGVPFSKKTRAGQLKLTVSAAAAGAQSTLRIGLGPRPKRTDSWLNTSVTFISRIHENMPLNLAVDDVLLVQLDDRTWHECEVKNVGAMVTTPASPASTQPTPHGAFEGQWRDGEDYTDSEEGVEKRRRASVYRDVSVEPGLPSSAGQYKVVMRQGSRYETRQTDTNTTEYTILLQNPTGTGHYDGCGWQHRKNGLSIWHRAYDSENVAGPWISVSGFGTIWSPLSSDNVELDGVDVYGPSFQSVGGIEGIAEPMIITRGYTNKDSAVSIRVKGIIPAKYDVRVGVGHYDWNLTNTKDGGNLNWVGLNSKSANPPIKTNSPIASMSLELKASDEMDGRVGDMIFTCERLLPYYKKGNGYNNGTWYEPKHHSARTRLNSARSAGVTTLLVSNRDKMKTTGAVLAGATLLPVDSHWGFRVGDMVTVANNIASQTTTLGASASANAFSLTLADSTVVDVHQEVTVALTDGSTHSATVVLKSAGGIVKLNTPIPSGASSGATFTALAAIETQITKLWSTGAAEGFPNDKCISIQNPAHVALPSNTSVAQANLSGTTPGAQLKTGDDILIQTNGDDLSSAPVYVAATLTSDLTAVSAGVFSFTISSGLASACADGGLVIQDRSKFKTQSPAWAFAEVLRGPGQPRPIEDKYIDADSLKDWHDFTLDPAGDSSQPTMHFNTVIDFRSTTMEILERIASSARGSVHMRDGRIGVIWDRNRASGPYAAAPTAMFTPRNILQGSYKNSFSFTDMPHAMRLRFTDVTGASQEHLIYQSGYNEDGSGGKIAASRYDTISAWGITDPDEAYRYAIYTIKSMQLRTETVGIDVDLEGSVMVERGDVVLISHDVDFTGLTWGRIKSIAGTGDADSIVIENEVTIEHGSNYVIRVRESGTNTFPFYDVTNSASDGSPISTTTIPLASSVTTANASNPAQVANLTVGDLVAFGKSTKETRRMVVGSVSHREDLTASLSLVPEAPEIFTAELTGALPSAPEAQTYFNDRMAPRPPRINDVGVVRDEMQTSRRRIRVSVSPALADDVQAGSFEVQFRRTRSHASGVFPGISVTSSYDWGDNVTVPAGQTVTIHSDFLSPLSHPEEIGQACVRVRATRAGVSNAKSPWVEAESIDRISAAISEYTNVRVRHLQLTRGWWAGLRPGGKYEPSFNRFTEFFSSSPSFKWGRHVSFNEPPMEHMQGIGSELYPDQLTGDLYTQEELLSGLSEMTYMVEIKDTTGTVLRSEEVHTPQYTYDLEKNIVDGGPRRDFTISVTPKFAIPKESATVSLSVSNPAHPAPTFTLSQNADSGIVRISVPNSFRMRTDFAGFLVCASLDSGFTPALSNVVFSGPSLGEVSIPILVPSQWYFKVACYDRFDEALIDDRVSQLTFSAEVGALLAPSVGASDILVGDPLNMAGDPVWKYSGTHGQDILNRVVSYHSHAETTDNSQGWKMVTQSPDGNLKPRTGKYMLAHEYGSYTVESILNMDFVTWPAVEGKFDAATTWVETFYGRFNENAQGYHCQPGESHTFSLHAARDAGKTHGGLPLMVMSYRDDDGKQVGTWDGLATDSGYDITASTAGYVASGMAANTWYGKTITGTVPLIENTGSTITGTGYDGSDRTYTSESVKLAYDADNPALLVPTTPTHMYSEVRLIHFGIDNASGYQSQMANYFDNISIRRTDQT